MRDGKNVLAIVRTLRLAVNHFQSPLGGFEVSVRSLSDGKILDQVVEQWILVVLVARGRTKDRLESFSCAFEVSHVDLRHANFGPQLSRAPERFRPELLERSDR